MLLDGFFIDNMRHRSRRSSAGSHARRFTLAFTGLWFFTIVAAPPCRTEHRVTAIAAFRYHVERTLRAAAEALPARASGEHTKRRMGPVRWTSGIFSAFLEQCGGAALK
jgi:hypothetical protein